MSNKDVNYMWVPGEVLGGTYDFSYGIIIVKNSFTFTERALVFSDAEATKSFSKDNLKSLVQYHKELGEFITALSKTLDVKPEGPFKPKRRKSPARFPTPKKPPRE